MKDKANMMHIKLTISRTLPVLRLVIETENGRDDVLFDGTGFINGYGAVFNDDGTVDVAGLKDGDKVLVYNEESPEAFTTTYDVTAPAGFTHQLQVVNDDVSNT